MSMIPAVRTATSPASHLDVYDRVADAAAALVIREYSSSFGLASRLLREPVRGHVRNIYALVRLAGGGGGGAGGPGGADGPGTAGAGTRSARPTRGRDRRDDARALQHQPRRPCVRRDRAYLWHR